jgi:hypothetical protein
MQTFDTTIIPVNSELTQHTPGTIHDHRFFSYKAHIKVPLLITFCTQDFLLIKKRFTFAIGKKAFPHGNYCLLLIINTHYNLIYKWL